MELCFWNSNGFGCPELNQAKSLSQSRPNLGIFSFTEIKKNLNNNDDFLMALSALFPPTKWQTLYSPGKLGPGQGILTLVKRPTGDTDCAIEISDKTTLAGELCHEISITKNQEKYSILSLYVSPNNKNLSTEFKNLMAHQNIVAGDLNKSRNTQPNRFSEYLSIQEAYSFEDLVDRCTFIPHTSEDGIATTTPDVALTTGQFGECLTVLNHATLKSDHLPLLMTTDFKINESVGKKSGKKVYYDYNALDRDFMEGLWGEMVEQAGWEDIKKVTGGILGGIKRTSRGNEKVDEMELLVGTSGEVMSINDHWGKFIAGNTTKMANLKELFQLAARFENADAGLKPVKWKKLSNRSLKRNWGAFKGSVSKISRLSHDEHLKYERILRFCTNEMHKNREKFKFTLEEYNIELDKLNKGSTPGPDHMHACMLPKTAVNKKKILNFFNDIVFRRSIFPQQFQESLLLFIEKSPPSDSGKLRPLCIGQRLSALLGRLVAARVQPMMDEDEVYKDRFGFRTKLGCEEYLGSLFDEVIDAKNEKQEIGLIQCDLAGAYTSVSHKRLILAFFEFVDRSKQEIKPWYLVCFVRKWLDNRTIYFEKTATRMDSGIVQGCPFSPVAFVVFLDYVNKWDNARFLYFCDDVSFVCRADKIEELVERMKVIFDEFDGWISAKEMACEPTKSKFMIFHKNKETTEKYFKNFKNIPVVDHLRVLGVIVDSRLTFNIHVQKVCNRMRSRTNCLRRLKKVGLCLDHAVQFAACVRMGLIFGLFWIGAISKTNWNKLETHWTNLLRKACHQKTPKSTKIHIIHKVSGYGSLKDFVEYLFHLRTTKVMKCEKFTLEFGELQSTKNFMESIRNAENPVGSVRSCTRVQTLKHVDIKVRNSTKKELGFIKLYTYDLAVRDNWTDIEFGLDKDILRSRYSVVRNKSHFTANWNDEKLLRYFRKNAYKTYMNIHTE